MAPSLLLWNDKSERSVFTAKNSDAEPLQFALKFEPIVDLSTALRYGCEVLTHLPANINSEKYFHQLSVQHRLHLFYQQIDKIKCYPQGLRYSLNLPMQAFLSWPLFHSLITPSPSSLIIEIQDPNTFYSLSTPQRAIVYGVIQHLENHGIPIWLDDVNEQLLGAFSAANWHLSGVKLDKNTFWTLSHVPEKLRQVIQMGRAIAGLVVVEGIETQKQQEIALLAGANLGQGYLWPAIYPEQAQ
ncbi:TPA: EAL domain-containing protein [Citrobacter pasteurii]